MNTAIAVLAFIGAVWGFHQIGWKGGSGGTQKMLGFLDVPIIQETSQEISYKNLPSRNRVIGDWMVFGLGAGVVVLFAVLFVQSFQ
jgi:hypothetical protein